MKKNVDEYYTIEKEESIEIKIKSSKFIGYAGSVKHKDDAMNFIEKIRTKHFDATHNCFAYQIGWDKDEFRYSDDGEPTGTAGRPIYMTLNKYDISDIVVVVTRYFGGTLLGTGGLIRAYSNTSEEVLKVCQKKIVYCTAPVKIICRYEEISFIKRIVNDFAISFKEEYTDTICIIANIPISKTKQFMEKISSTSNTKASCQLI